MDVLIQALMPFFSTQVPDAQFDIDIPRAARLLDLEMGETGETPKIWGSPHSTGPLGSIKCVLK